MFLPDNEVILLEVCFLSKLLSLKACRTVRLSILNKMYMLMMETLSLHVMLLRNSLLRKQNYGPVFILPKLKYESLLLKRVLIRLLYIKMRHAGSET